MIEESEATKGHEALPYVCVRCSQPCSALYKRLSVSLSSIKAMTCTSCGKLVDPYIEREWLLVVIDCILLREEAYRHILFNVDGLRELSKERVVQMLLAWTFLDASLKWQAHQNVEGDDEENVFFSQDKMFWAGLLTSSLPVIPLQWIAMESFLTSTECTKGAQIKLFWALILPSSFSIVTMLVSIWENTETVRLLGSILIACWQCIAIFVVSSDFSTPIIGLLAGVVWRLVCSMVWTKSSICLGLDLEISGGLHRLCFT